MESRTGHAEKMMNSTSNQKVAPLYQKKDLTPFFSLWDFLW